MKKLISVFIVGLSLFFGVSFAYADESERCIVVLKQTNDGDLVTLNDMSDLKPIDDETGIYETNINRANELQKQGNIEEIIENQEIYIPDEDYQEINNISDEIDTLNYNSEDTYFNTQWYFDSLNIGELKNLCGNGKGVRIVVIDSGVNKNHEDFENSNIETGYNYCANEKSDTYDTDIYDLSDEKNHGTGVIGLIAASSNNNKGISGIADGSTIIPLKVIDNSSSSSLNLYYALADAIDKFDADIINISLGSLNLDSSAFTRLTQKANSKGIIICAAAGNDGRKATGYDYFYPASFPYVISIGSVTSNLTRAKHSQMNDSIKMLAPGESLYILSKTGGYAINSGTSFASPIATAVFAILKSQFNDLDYQKAVKSIKAGTFDRGADGYDIYYGYGIMDAMGLYNYLASDEQVFISPYREDNGSYMIKVYADDIENAILFFEKFKDEKPTQIEYDKVLFSDNIATTTIQSVNQNSNQNSDEDFEKIKIFVIKDYDSFEPLIVSE